MTDLTYLKGLIDLAKTNEVTHIKMPGLELSFGKLSPEVEVQASAPALDPLEGLRKAEESLPPDLRADDLMNEDKVLFYSSPPSADEMPLPLTGDQPL